MFDNDSETSRRFGGIRPGMTLVAIERAAVPVTNVRIDVLAQQRKPFALLDEFVLRLTAAGLRSTSEIAEICGLDEMLVESTVAEQVANGNLNYSAASQRFALTSFGTAAVQDLESVQPIEMSLPIKFDRMIWDVEDYRSSDLVTRPNAVDFGMIVLPASRSSRISLDDVPTPKINSFLKSGRGPNRRVEVLLAKRVHPDVHRYLPVELLIFAANDSHDVDIAVVVDDELSDRHSRAVAAIGGASALGIRIAEPEQRPRLPSELEILRTESRNVAMSEEREVPTSPVRSLEVFEHRLQLDRALKSATNRILIVSPWIRSAVVDQTFVALLEQRLRAGVRVHIGHGYGKDDRGSDKVALERLGELAQRFSGQFSFVRLPNTHAKILIFDGSWISTSFNWLSFRGDPDRTYRMEEGTLVRISDQVDKEYKRYVEFLAAPEG